MQRSTSDVLGFSTRIRHQLDLDQFSLYDLAPGPESRPKARGALMARLGHLVVRRRRRVVAVWVLVMLITGAVGMASIGRLSTDFGAGDRTEAGRVAKSIRRLSPTGGEIAIVADGIDMTDPTLPATLRPGLTRLRAMDGVAAVDDPWSADSPDTAAALTARDGRAALVIVRLAPRLDSTVEEKLAGEISSVARDIDAPEIHVGGEVLINEQFTTASENDLLKGEAIALPIAIIAMAFILGGLVAAGMPLLVAVAGILSSLAVLAAATFVGDVSIFSLNVVNMLGLGLGIDYGLLMVNRFREERGHGLDVHEAVARTVATAGTTVLFSALTVSVAMFGLFVFDVPLLSSFGLAGLGVVMLSMAAAITFLPAVMAIVGRRITPKTAIVEEQGRFYRLARVVQRRAGLVTVAIVTLLVVLASPFLSARLENGDARSLPRSTEVRAVALAMKDRFPSRGAEPITAIAQVDTTSPEFAAWSTDLANLDGVADVSVRPTTGQNLTVVDITPTGTSQDATATDLVGRIRAGAPADLQVRIGGPAADLIEIKQILGDRLPLALAMIVLATLVLLFLMTGSIVVPIKAVLMNILSLGASFGALVWIFQNGHLSGALSFDSVGAIDLWMPILVLIFAFGLSMDYEVFLLSRIKEIHDSGADTDTAVALGLQRTGLIITSAALLIIVVFAGFAAGEVLAIKQLGVGLAVAVFIDATIVRTLLVPATMRLLGQWNWWAPAPLRRFHQRFGLHEVSQSVVEGARNTASAGDAR